MKKEIQGGKTIEAKRLKTNTGGLFFIRLCLLRFKWVGLTTTTGASNVREWDTQYNNVKGDKDVQNVELSMTLGNVIKMISKNAYIVEVSIALHMLDVWHRNNLVLRSAEV